MGARSGDSVPQPAAHGLLISLEFTESFSDLGSVLL